jgi:hypothetical protein
MPTTLFRGGTVVNHDHSQRADVTRELSMRRWYGRNFSPLPSSTRAALRLR